MNYPGFIPFRLSIGLKAEAAVLVATVELTDGAFALKKYSLQLTHINKSEHKAKAPTIL